MAKSDIPIPACGTCGKPDSTGYKKGDTTYLCKNCGTELRYMPAGELLHSGGSKAKENNGWVVSFSVTSSELYSSRAMFVLGVVILILTLVFLWIGKIGADAAFWTAGSGLFLAVIGKRKSIMQKRKTALTLTQYPYWNK